MDFRNNIDENEILNNDKNDNINNENKNNLLKYKWFKGIFFVSLLIIIVIIVIVLILIFTSKKDKMEDEDKIINESESIKIRLTNWEFGSIDEIDLSGEKISIGITSDKFYKAPEDFYVCTAMGGLSGHTNKYFYEKELQNINNTQFDSDWWFKSNFTLKNFEFVNNLVLLHINGINYKSDVYLDGKLIDKQENVIGAFVKYVLDITQYLNRDIDMHYIAFKIKRPYNQWGGGEDNYNQTDLAISFVDWNPEPPDSNMGVWQPVDIELLSHKISTISSAFVITKLIDDSNSKLNIVFHIKNWENKKVDNNINIKIGDFININIGRITLEPNEERLIFVDNSKYPNLKIDNSKLWWPYQMGEPRLHNLTINITNNNNYYLYKRKIGLRQVDSELDEKEKKRVYKINNKKILLKGAGWTPDLFLRQSPENYWNHISYVRDMELNVIRLEGKSEGEEFYDYCDRLGIMIIAGWNCADAWQRWEYWNLEVEEISNKSVISQIRKLSPHPSVIIFILGSDYAPKNGIEGKWRKIFEEEKWPNEILSSASSSSGEGYPTGVKMTGPYSWVPPNYFFLEKSKNEIFGGAWGFLTEGGPGENPLRKGSYEKIFNEENIYNYTGDNWNYHCGNKKDFGNLDKLIKPINERYGNIIDFNDFQKKSCAITYESHRAMFEAYSFNKYNSTGVIQWMLNNAWPSNIWHLYDYFFSPTPTYFGTKKAGEKIHIMYNYEDSCIYLLNNYFQDFKDNLILNMYVISGVNGKEIIEDKSYTYNSIKGDEIIKVDEIKNNNYPNIYILHLEYSINTNGNINSFTNTYWLNRDMDEIDYDVKTFYNVGIKKYADLTSLQNISNTTLKIEIIDKKIIDDGKTLKNLYKIRITNIGETIALLLEMKLYEKNEKNENKIITPIFWSDNYFSVRSGESYDINVDFYNNKNNILLEIIGWNNEYSTIIN